MHLWSRNGREWSAEFVAITAAVMALSVTRIAMDGEAVAHCPGGLPDFNARLGRYGCASASSMPSTSCTSTSTFFGPWRPLSAARCYGGTSSGPGRRCSYSEHMDGADGEAMFRHARAMGLEGIVSIRV